MKWAQENPNYLELYRYGEPRQTLTRGQGYLSEAAAASARIPTGHPEGYLEAFATIYVGVVEAIRQYIDGDPMQTEDYDFPTVYDGLRGMQFIYKTVESCENGLNLGFNVNSCQYGLLRNPFSCRSSVKSFV